MHKIDNSSGMGPKEERKDQTDCHIQRKVQKRGQEVLETVNPEAMSPTTKRSRSQGEDPVLNGDDPTIETGSHIHRSNEMTGGATDGGKDLQQMMNECYKYREQIITRWKWFKKYLSLADFLDNLYACGLLSPANMENLNDMDRSLALDRVLTESVWEIHDQKNFEKFKEAVRLTNPLVEIDWNSHPQQLMVHQSISRDHQYRDNFSNLMRHQHRFKQILKLDIVIDIKDDFLEQHIINLHEHERIAADLRGLNSVNTFIEIILSKIKQGSDPCYQCLICSLQRKREEMRSGNNISSFLQALQDTAQRNIVQAQPEHQVSVKLIDGKVYQAIEETDGFMAKLTINTDNSSAVYRNIQENVNAIVEDTATMAGYIEKTETGSVVIYFKSLDNDMGSRLKRSLVDGSFTDLLAKLFNSTNMKTTLCEGKYQLEVSIESTDADSLEYSATVLGSGDEKLKEMKLKKNIVAVNRPFLAKQIDTAQLLKFFSEPNTMHHEEFRKANIASVADRIAKANIFLSVIDKLNLEETLYNMLKEKKMNFVFNRLKTSERVYSHSLEDGTRLRRNFIKLFKALQDTFDIDDVRDVFVDRGFNEKVFDELENKFKNNRSQAMAAFLLEVLKSGTIAMLTFVDILYISRMEVLANELLMAFEPRLKDGEKTGNTQGILFKGVFEVVVETSDKERIERENFYRYSNIVFEFGREALIMLLDCQLQRKGITLDRLIIKHRHALYHSAIPEKCCQCTFKPPKKFPNGRILHQYLDTLFDKQAAKLRGHIYNKYTKHHYLCCSPVKRCLTPEHLEFALAKYLITILDELSCIPADLIDDINEIECCRNELTQQSHCTMLSHSVYLKSKVRIQTPILKLCHFCETENKMIRNLRDTDIRPQEFARFLQQKGTKV